MTSDTSAQQINSGVFIRRPTPVSAILYTGENAQEVIDWANLMSTETVETGVGSFDGFAANILRLFSHYDSVTVVGPNCWILADEHGDLGMMRDAAFRKVYKRQ